MAEKILRLAPGNMMFLGKRVHLVFPERPFVQLPDNYVPTDDVIHGIKTGAIIDVNNNILVDDKAPAVETKAVKEEKKAAEQKEEAPVEEVAESEEVVEEGKGSKTKRQKK